jgi:hypothetical protein
MEKNTASRDELIRFEPHLDAILQSEKYAIESVSPLELFTHNRFDLAIKLLYLDNKLYNDTFSRRIYADHIRALTVGSFRELGNDQKSNLKSFEDTFSELYSSICSNGFDAKKSLVPLSQNGTIVNGAHRVTCAIALKKPVKCVKIDTLDYVYDYKFFRDSGLNQSMLDAATIKFVETGKNVFIATIWPAAKGDLLAAEKIIPNIIYKKQINLNANGGANLISIVYQGCSWLGNLEQGFPGVSAKLVKCFAGSNPVIAIAFQAPTLSSVKEIKTDIRNIFGIGKHSIHITDTKEEAVTVARLLFNDNAVHFLNYAKPSKFQSTFDKIERFKCFLKKNEFNPNEFALDAGMVLSLYGLREASDIDYLYIGEAPITFDSDHINHHDDSLPYHGDSEADLVMDPANYFYFDDIKFVSFSQLYRLKKNRMHTKDKNDLLMMRGMDENKKVTAIIGVVKQKFTFARIRVYHQTLDILRSVGLYKIVRWGYRKLRKIHVEPRA